MDANDLHRISKLFKEKGWPLAVDHASPFPTLFDDYCNTYKRLMPEWRELLLQLTRSYKWICLDKYIACAMDIFKQQVVPYAQGSFKGMDILPLTDPDKPTQAKSGHAFWYALQGYRKSLTTLSDFDIEFYGSVSHYMNVAQKSASRLVIIVDDYIGTGASALKFLEMFRRENHGRATNVAVFALVAQEQGSVLLKKKGYNLFVGRLMKRGISDNASISNKSKSIRMMEDIGDFLSVKKDLLLGYESSEGLVTMQRTPNNTFPVFWTNKKTKGGELWTPPFPR